MLRFATDRLLRKLGDILDQGGIVLVEDIYVTQIKKCEENVTFYGYKIPEYLEGAWVEIYLEAENAKLCKGEFNAFIDEAIKFTALRIVGTTFFPIPMNQFN